MKGEEMLVFLSGLVLGTLFGITIMALFSAGKRESEARERSMQEI